jgi:transposase InsO family protein
MDHGIRVSRNRVERLMRKAAISGLVPRKRGKTTVRVPGVRVADDLLLRNFTATGPNQVWVADITYLKRWEGWIYLAAIQDLFSRRIVGWSMADHMRAELVVDALMMAVHRRKPDPGLIHHSDKGSQYVSLAFGQMTRKNGINRSMGHVGLAYDKAVSETIFATLNRELVHRRPLRPMRDNVSYVN